MPANNAARAEREKKLKSLLSFASKLADRLDESLTNPTLIDDVQMYLRTLPLQVSSTVATKRGELDTLGTELWNLSTRLRRDAPDTKGRPRHKDNDDRKKTLCLVRVFAFFLLEAGGAQTVKGRDNKSCVRLMRVALKTAKVCLEQKELDAATKVLEKAAELQEALGKRKDSVQDAETELEERLRVEYFVVRAALAWRQDRMEIAELMYSKAKQVSDSHRIEPTVAEQLSDLLFEIGKGLLKSKNYEWAVKWLARADDMLGTQELEMLSPDAGELRLSILQSLVQANMKLQTPEASEKAWQLVGLLENDYGDKIVVSLLKLELLSRSAVLDIDRYHATLLRMIRTVTLTSSTFKTIMHHIHTLKEHKEHRVAACKILDEFIDLRLISVEDQDWLEKAVITRIWFSTTQTAPAENYEPLRDLFDCVCQRAKQPFGAPATHAAQTLLWKSIELFYNQGQYATAELWCRLAAHRLFEKAGDLNKAKISRKFIMCALGRQDCAAAREAFSHMTDTAKAEALTRYLMYKVALKDGDADFIAECLEQVFRHSSGDLTLLYACVLEAQTAGDRQQTILALQKILKRFDHETVPTGLHLPAFFRCTARLLISELTSSGSLNQEAADEIAYVFESAATQAKASRKRPSGAAKEQFTKVEFEWFSKNAFNLSLKYCAEMHPECLLRLLNACIQFISLLEDQDQEEPNRDLPLRMMFCNFLSACASITLARAEDNIQASLQHYLTARKHCHNFRALATYEMKENNLEESAKTDTIAKHFQIVKLELEAALKLEDWDSMDALFEECFKYDSPKHYETLADLVLVIHSHIIKANLVDSYQRKIFKTLQTIINTFHRHTPSLTTLSRYLRLLFSIALSFDDNVSLQCVQQAIDIAALRQGEPEHYPEVELEWLATTAFNRAVDYYVSGDDEGCKRWAEKALSLSGWAEDVGGVGCLRGVLVERYAGLAFGGRE